MTIHDRLLKIIDEFYSGNKRSFSQSVGVSAAVIENIVGKRKSMPSFQVLEKIILSLENIDVLWLMTGKGEMLRVQNTIQGDRNPVGNNQGTISGNNVGDNSINISAPTKGEQKIIYPDRTIEVTQSTQGYSYVAETQSSHGNVDAIIAEKNKQIELQSSVIRLQEELIERLRSDK